MADIYFKCGCGKTLAVDENGVGRMVNCPDCGTQFMIPGAVLEWVCPQCGASMLAPAELSGTWVQCVHCQSEVQAPAPEGLAAAALGISPVKAEASPSENLSAHLNRKFKICPQCHERVPIQTRQCPHCEYLFSRRAPKGIVAGALCGVIVAGIVFGLWQAKIWPFKSGKPAFPAAPPVTTVSHPESNAVASAPAAAPVLTAQTEEVSVVTNTLSGILTSTNAASLEEWLSRFGMARQFMAAQLAKAYPWCSPNQFVSLRQIDGRMIHGTNIGAEAAGVTLVVDAKPMLIAFQNLDAYDRLKVDDAFRSTWIDAQAAAFSRRSLEQEGIEIPSLSTNSEEFLDQALSLGDPQAQYQMGQQHYKQKDYADAFLYLQAAAQSHAGAQYALGMMCYLGMGAGTDKRAGLTWLALAAAQGHAKAEQFIQQHKVSAEILRKLLQQEQSRKDRETKNWAALDVLQRQSPATRGVSVKVPLKLDDPIVFTEEATGRRYVYRQGKKVYI